MTRVFLALACTLLISAPAGRPASVTPLLRETANEILRKGSPGVSIALIANGVVTYYNAGASERPKLPVTNRTIYEVASITKVFTTTLLGLDVARDVKSLDDRVQKYMPGYRLRPKMQGATLRMLGTFTAGLPQAPLDYARLPQFDRGIDHYSVRRFLRFVSHWTPKTRLPAPRAYADASVGLLGLCLGNLSLDTWEERLHTEIFDPLGMPDTAMDLTSAQEQRFARGRQPNGAFAPRWPIDAMAASDALKSTTFDLAQFLLALLGENANASAELEKAMSIATRAEFLVRFSNFREFQALAWRRIPLAIGGRTFWITTKNGDLPGFTSEISFNRDLGIGVAILTNVGQMDLNDFDTTLIKRVAQQR